MAVNRLAEKGSWDVGELKAEFEELIISGAPIEISGFGAHEIDAIVIGDDRDEAEPKSDDLVPELPRSAIARVGDLFQLGPHRLICGDGNDPDVVQRLMHTDVARLVFTDLAFDAAIPEHKTVRGQRQLAMASTATTDPPFRAIHRAWMAAVLPHLMDGGLLGAFMDWRSLPDAHAAATALGLIPVDLVVWAKPNAGDGDLYRSAHELLPLFKKGTAAHVHNDPDGKRGRRRSNLWTTPEKVSPGPGRQQKLQDRPAGKPGKPTTMLEDALMELTDRDDIILDPFLGSGSTLVAAQNTGRVCCGVELDPLYVDVIIRRHEASTGIAAILADSGETFEQVATRRPNDERRSR
jgi:DNA methylase